MLVFVERDLYLSKSPPVLLAHILSPIIWVGVFGVIFSLHLETILYCNRYIPYLVFLVFGVVTVSTFYTYSSIFATVRLDFVTRFMYLVISSGNSFYVYFMGKIIAQYIMVLLQSLIIFAIVYMLSGFYLTLLLAIILCALLFIYTIFWSFIGVILSLYVRSHYYRDLIFTLLNPMPLISTAYYTIPQNQPLLATLLYANPITYQADLLRSIILLGYIDIKLVAINVILLIVISLITIITIQRKIYY